MGCKITLSKKPELLADYIASNFKSKAEFARVNGVSKQNVNTWVNAGYVVINGVMYLEKLKIQGEEQ